MTKQKERARRSALKKNISAWSEDLFGTLTADLTEFVANDSPRRATAVVVALSDEETLTTPSPPTSRARKACSSFCDKTPFYVRWAVSRRPRRHHRR